jgi:hypothetical protein
MNWKKMPSREVYIDFDAVSAITINDQDKGEAYVALRGDSDHYYFTKETDVEFLRVMAKRLVEGG